ncbi:hypothetical protein NMY22_g3275 [Coprinellus aureogranulatus]|nr:hypothetical protein NMY22_g3275 [Coprinellus aureogranulatus]
MASDAEIYTCSSPDSATKSDSPPYDEDDAWLRHPPLQVIFQRLEKGIGGKIHSGVDIAKFAEEVWGIEADVVDMLLSMPIELGGGKLANYEQCTDDDDRHKAFFSICESLLEAAYRRLDIELGDSFRDTFWCGLGQAHSRSPSVPDVVDFWDTRLSNSVAPSLGVAKSLVEVKDLTWRDPDTDDEDIYGVDAAPSGENDSKRPTSNLKRSFGSMKDGDGSNGRQAKKRRCDEESPVHESLLPLYANEALGASSRYYVVGLVVDRLEVSVCYFDRCLVACTAPFSFVDKPGKLALVLYAITQSDRSRAGFDPHLRRSCSHDADGLTVKPNDNPLCPIKDVAGSCFEYPAHTAHCTGAPLSDGSSTLCLRVNDVLRVKVPNSVIGCGATVYKVQYRLPNGTFSDDEYAFKLSWPAKNRPSEVEVVKTLKERVPLEAHVHFPDFIATFTFSAADLRLPWLRLELNLTSEKVQRGVYLARKLGRVMHRDLSEESLMALKLPGGEIKGVLNDWDMAKFVDDGNSEDPYETEPRPGTLPFMALDDIVSPLPDPAEHWFRDELESLFWILLWAAIHYNLKEGTRDNPAHKSLWEFTTTGKACWTRKTVLLAGGSYFARTISPVVKPEFAAIMKEWIVPLHDLFAHSRMELYREDDVSDEVKQATYNGRVTFKTFMAAINVTPRTWGIPGYRDSDDF